jgi:hypothetical protein
MDQIAIAVLRKLIFIVLLLVTYLVIDRVFLHGFKTHELLKDNAVAVALLLGLLGLAVAFA